MRDIRASRLTLAEPANLVTLINRERNHPAVEDIS
jgi:hypothetical protein